MNRRRLLQAVGSSVAGVACVGAAESVSGMVTAGGMYTDEYLYGYHYTKYVPSGGGEALLVMLHGCLQEPTEFARATEMNEVAESENVVVIYPDQSSFANPADCWYWYYDYHTERGTGEGTVITEMTLHEMSRENVNRSRIYIAGFSAGAAMVPNLLVAYPDVYAAGGVHSGVEYDAADTAAGATYAAEHGGPDPDTQGEKASEAMLANGVVGRTPTIVFHGSADDIVDPINGTQATIQTIETNDLVTDAVDNGNVDTDPEETTTGTTGGYEWRRDRFADAGSRVHVEYWLIGGMGHEWAGGAASEEFTAPGAPEASRTMWDFFTRWSL